MQVRIDCDVIQADGGTRTASITGGFVALHLACQNLVQLGLLSEIPLFDEVAAISCGLYEGLAVLDLDYGEDSNAQADANFVLTGKGGIVEIQGTAEDRPFSEEQLHQMLGLAKKGIGELVDIQKSALGL
jgi:ribonuclease PH